MNLLLKLFSKSSNKNQLINCCRYFNHKNQQKLILGIETSCDDTGIAIVDNNKNILSEICQKQTSIHVSNGGIIPPVARDLHRLSIDNCVRKCLEKISIKPTDLTAIAVTIKPGLPLSLLIGLNYAKKLSHKYYLPLIPVDHMEAHALTPLIESNELKFPYLTLLISGGHTEICFVKSIEKFYILGRTIDSLALGDFFDKISRELKLKNLGKPYDRISGGESLELLSQNGDAFKYFQHTISYPYYSDNRRTCNFSFSGLLTIVKKKIRELEMKNNTLPNEILKETNDLCASILFITTFILIKRIQRAFQFLIEKQLIIDNKILTISGGCAANTIIRKMFKNYCQYNNIQLFIPSKYLCTDNGIMIAWNGQLKLINNNNINYDENFIKNLDINSKSKLGIDWTDQLTMSNIKCDPMDIKQFY